MIPLALTRLVLTDFRNYTYLKLETDTRPVVLTGPNGSGKTNLLEAISFFSPGRGLRRARLKEVGNTDAKKGWAVSALLKDEEFEHRLGTGLITKIVDGDIQERRTVRIDGENNLKATDFGSLISVGWLTPQMDRLFHEGAGGRRRFLDRLAFGYDPEHAKRTALYEKTMRERNRLLKEGRLDPHWLSSLEHRLAELGFAIHAVREETTARLNQAMLEEEQKATNASVKAFPKAEITIAGEFEDNVSGLTALAAEDHFRDELAKRRQIDGRAGSTTYGPHRADMAVFHREKDQEAALCSTGEQKALLISIILADARLQAGLHGKAPVLLLDEITAHLDQKRRQALFDEIIALDMQAWMTGTDQLLFSELGERAQFFTVDSGRISPAELC
ncbi:DNA replication/repair protein RecF [Sneathiella limimaris]|uniref:DNA replication/repair protein RecF n=1 Tax=Sneathiella limimaris TaxID=1964213 RepID=UPI0019D2BE28|nr:DNA replication/repair protein RecF [Sneathiella limimaris]